MGVRLAQCQDFLALELRLGSNVSILRGAGIRSFELLDETEPMTDD
jgi:hypothetical protein